ncbi:MAG: PLP-dependent aminotransferase family protein [Burkholderiales bacterium]|nr:PLP-dependent aminotransferase family protein [Burkholderiales bacterium]
MLSEFLLVELARLRAASELPLHRQLYEALRRVMLDGYLQAGERLASSRDLAQGLGLSRNTVITALNQLTVEGYLVSRVGSGTYVSDNCPKAARKPRAQLAVQRPHLSRRGEALTSRYTADQLEVQPFTAGIPDFSVFPTALWQRLQNKHWRMSYPEMLDYSCAGGHAPLRRAVADYLRVFRSVQLDADQVIITAGTQQSIALCAHLLADPGDTLWIEDPAYWGAVKALTAGGLRLHPVAVDGEGMAPGAADEAAPPRLIYVTPSHQYPTGAVMSLARRQQLLDTAGRHGAWILEDDYDSEFRFSGPPVSSLAGLDKDERVLYMGTFSKVLYPGLKLGYLVVPKSLIGPFRQAHYDLNRPGQMPLQAALSEFIGMGHFTAALRKSRVSYALRRQSLLEGLKPCLGEHAFISGAGQGLHLCVRLPPTLDDQALARRIAEHGLLVRPLSGYCLQRRDARGLVIGYGYAPLAGIRQGAPVLARLIQEELRRWKTGF